MSHVRIAFAAVSSVGHSYKFPNNIVQSVPGGKRRMTIITSDVSTALIQICVDHFMRNLPVNCFSSPLGTMLRVSIISV